MRSCLPLLRGPLPASASALAQKRTCFQLYKACTPTPALQAMRALKELHDNLTAERRLLLEMHHVWHATVTPHQLARGELATRQGAEATVWRGPFRTRAH